MAQIRYESYEYLDVIPAGEGIWHSWGPTDLMPDTNPATVTITAAPFTYPGDPYSVLRVEDVHVTRFRELGGPEYYGATVFNAGPGWVTFYRIGVTKIGNFPTPQPAVVGGSTPT